MPALKHILLLLSWPVIALQAQQHSLWFDHCSVKNGLSQGSGYAITQDKDGFIWMGTQNGLNQYDGYQVNVYYHGVNNYPGSNYITSLLTDSSGNVWIGSTGGLSMVDHTSRQFIPFSNYIQSPTLLDSINITRLWQDARQNTWVLSFSKGVFCIDNATKKVKHFFAEEQVVNQMVDITADKSGAIWLAMQHAIFRFNEEQQQFVPMPLVAVSENTTIRALCVDQNNNLWIGTFEDGIYITDASAKTIRHLNRADNNRLGLVSNEITSLLQDKEGNCWIGTRNGLNRYLANSDSIVHATHMDDVPESLARNFVLSLFEDRQSNIWIGLSGEGFDKYNANKYRFRLYRHIQNGSDDIGDNMILSIRRLTPGYLHFGTQSSGLVIMNEATGKFTHYTKGAANSIIHNTVYDIDRDNSGAIWLATWGGLCSYKAGNFRRYDNPGKKITELYTVHKLSTAEVLWVSGTNGTFRFDINTQQWLKWNAEETNSVGTQIVRVFYEDEEQHVWMGTENNTVIRYNSRDNTITVVKLPSSNTQNVVRCLKKDGLYLWIGSDNGWMKLNTQTLKIERRYTSENGLPDNVVYSMEKDEQGNWWLGTNKGLTCYTLSNGFFRLYNESDGLQSNEFNTNCSATDAGGKLYFGGINGFNSFNPSELLVKSLPPIIRFTAIKLFDDAYLAGLATDRVEHLTFNHRQNFISFEFAALNFSASENATYYYMMEGVDATWLNSGTRRYVSYTSMRPGNYVFKVRSINRDGVFSGNIATLSIRINPPWWQTWWAYASYVLMLGAVIYGLYRARIKTLEQKQADELKTMVITQENERKRLSRDLHDDIGTKLSAIKLYVSSFEHKLEEQKLEEAKKLAENSGQLIDETMTGIRKMLLNLSPDVLEEFGYATAVEALVNRINETEVIHFNLVMFGLKQGLPKDHELSLYRITQELINNVLKHAQASEVSLQVGYRDEKIILMIEDNGKGFDVNAHKNGYGLKNLEARTRLLHGKMQIDSQPGKGTGILIEIPYKFNGHA